MLKRPNRSNYESILGSASGMKLILVENWQGTSSSEYSPRTGFPCNDGLRKQTVWRRRLGRQTAYLSITRVTSATSFISYTSTSSSSSQFPQTLNSEALSNTSTDPRLNYVGSRFRRVKLTLKKNTSDLSLHKRLPVAGCRLLYCTSGTVFADNVYQRVTQCHSL